MAIIVIEQGRPDGGDLVVGEHHLNPVARANAEPQKAVRVIDIGEGYGIIGLTLEPVVSFSSDETEQYFCAVLSVVGGKRSDLVPMEVTKLIIGEVGRLPVSKLREMLSRALGPEQPEVAQ